MKERQVIVTWYSPEEKTPEEDVIVVATITGKAKGIRFNHSFALLIWTEEGWLSLDWDFEELTVHAWADLEIYGGFEL